MSVRFELDNHVAHVTIDRPERMNAIDTETHRRLTEIWEQVEQDPEIRCVVLGATGDKAFCVGADLKEKTDLTGMDYWRGVADGFSGLPLRSSLKVPVIARVNGLALGGGLELVLGCDIVIAARSARFGLPEARVGRVPLDGGMVLLQRLIPRNIAVGMMMTGRTVDAEALARFGLINAVVPDQDLDTEVEAWVTDIMAAAPLPLCAIKALARETDTLSPQDAYRRSTPELIAALNSEDAEEGVNAFREKRKPRWKGR